jgi:hypothetical protein
MEASNTCEDTAAALDGLADYASVIHVDLDAWQVAERAAEAAEAAKKE